METPPSQRDVLILRILFLIFSAIFGTTTYQINKKTEQNTAAIKETQTVISAGITSMPVPQQLRKQNETTIKTK